MSSWRTSKDPLAWGSFLPLSPCLVLGEGPPNTRLRCEPVPCCLQGPRAHTRSPLRLCWDPRRLAATYSSIYCNLKSLLGIYLIESSPPSLEVCFLFFYITDA